MTISIVVLIPSKKAETAQTTQYTSPAGTSTIIDKFTATNYSGSAATLTVYLVTGGDTAGNQNIITKSQSLSAGESYTFPAIVGHILAPSGFISTSAGTADAISIRASGRQVS